MNCKWNGPGQCIGIPLGRSWPNPYPTKDITTDRNNLIIDFTLCAWSSRFPEWRLRLPLFLLYAVFNTTRNATAHLGVGSFSAGWMCFWMVVLVIIIFFRGRYAIYGIIAVDIIKWSTDEEVRPFGVWAGALLTTTYCWMVWIMWRS